MSKPAVKYLPKPFSTRRSKV